MKNSKNGSNKKSSGIGIGLAIGAGVGAAAGVAAALLFSPKSGKQNRNQIAKKVKQLQKKFEEARVNEKVKDIFGEVTEDTKDVYLHAKEGVIQRVAHMKEAVGNIDQSNYTKAVNDVVNIAKKELVKDARKVAKLKDSLMSYFSKVGKKTPPKKKSSPKRKGTAKKIGKKTTAKKRTKSKK